MLVFLGAYHHKTGLNGQELSDHMLFGSVVATTLVIVVTAQVSIQSPSQNEKQLWASQGSLALVLSSTTKAILIRVLPLKLTVSEN